MSGLAREDLFTVVFDQVLTDTAVYADVVLPATTFLEHYDFAKSYGPITLQLARPVIEPVAESRPNVDVFSDLAARLDLRRDGDADGELDQMLAVIAGLPPAISQSVADLGTAEPPHGGRPIQFVDVFPRTGDQKVHLWSDALSAEAPNGLYAYIPDPATAAYPLALISPASERTVSSTLGELERPTVRLEIHPDDATARGIEDGDEVRDLQRPGHARVPGQGDRPGASRHGGVPERRVATTHRQPPHVERPRARLAHRSGWRRVLQRRARPDRATGGALDHRFARRRQLPTPAATHHAALAAGVARLT